MIVQSSGQTQYLSESSESVTLLASVRHDATHEQASVEARFRWYRLSFVDFVDLDETVRNRGRRVTQNRLAAWWRSVPTLIDVAS